MIAMVQKFLKQRKKEKKYRQLGSGGGKTVSMSQGEKQEKTGFGVIEKISIMQYPTL